MGAVVLTAVFKSRFAASTVALLIGFILPLVAHSASRRPLALTSFEFRSNLRGQRLVSIERLKAALTEHLELMGEAVRVVDTEPGGRRCLTRECQMSLAQERQSDIIYGEIEQAAESIFNITLWLWKFDMEAGTPLTEYPISTTEICVKCDEISLTQKLLETAGPLVEQKIEHPERGALKVPATPMTPPRSGHESSRWQRLSTQRKMGVAVLGTVSAIGLIAAVALTVFQGSSGKNIVLVDQSNNLSTISLNINLAPFYGTAYGASAAAGAALLAVALW